MLWCCPRRATAIVQAVLVLHHVENPGYQATLLFPAAGHPPTQTNTFMEPHRSSRAARGIRSCRREGARASLKVIAVRIALAVEGVSKVPEKAPESFDFLGGRRSDGRTGRDMFPELVQRRVEVLGGRPIQSQHDVAFHPATLLSC